MPTETFTNTNGTELLTHSANWNAANMLSSDLVIDTNALRTPFSRGITVAAFYGGTFSSNQYAQATITQVGSALQRMGVGVRASSGNGYFFVAEAGGWILAKLISFGYTALASGSFTLAPGDVLYLEANGTTVTAKRNGTTISSVTDTSHTSGNPAVAGIGEAASGTYTLLDNWEGNSLSAAAQIFLTRRQVFERPTLIQY